MTFCGQFVACLCPVLPFVSKTRSRDTTQRQLSRVDCSASENTKNNYSITIHHYYEDKNGLQDISRKGRKRKLRNTRAPCDGCGQVVQQDDDDCIASQTAVLHVMCVCPMGLIVHTLTLV